jgi:diguanylate cyclase (GGDEF)-like protein
MLLADRLTQAMLAGKRKSEFGAVLFLDLDNFKPVNDNYGHGAGDLLLIEAARRLKSCVREIDTVARFGGDEFVVVLNELASDRGQAHSQVDMLAQKICHALAEPYVLHLSADGERPAQTIEHRCTASIGAMLFHGMAITYEEIIKRADLAMYRAKEEGLNLVRFYEPQ